MQPVAIRNIERADARIVAALGRAGVATVHEAQGRTGLLQPFIRPVYPGAKAAGTAVTVLTQPGDNWMLHVALELCQPGDLLVAACTVDNTDGMFGDLLATSAKARGVTGLVSDTGCRDVEELAAMPFPVWARAVSARGTVKNTPGCVNVPLVIAGQSVNPGDAVIADADGVVVVPRETAATALELAEQRLEKEENTRQQLADGVMGLDIYGMRSRLEAAGLVYYDDAGEWRKSQEAAS